jgi:beta-xylosidase
MTRTTPSARRSARFRNCVFSVLCILGFVFPAAAQKPYPVPAAKDRTCYLFVYIPGNSPVQNSVCYAVSTDGHHFFALNSGMPVMFEKTPSGTVGIRMPDLMRAEDGGFLMVATDTAPSNAPGSRHELLLMKSDDLIGWSQKTIDIPDRFPDMPRMQDLMDVYTPHAIYDPAAKKYLVYFTLVFRNGGNNNKIYGAYANADFTDLEGEPRLMAECNSSLTINASIIPSDGKYSMFFNARKEYVSDTLFPGKWSAAGRDSELRAGNVIEVSVPLGNGGKYVLLGELSPDGRRYYVRAKDGETSAQGGLSLGFNPTFGTAVPIARSELNALLKTWGKPDKFELPEQNNPVIEAFYADPGTLYSEKTGKYYIYPTHDGFPGWGGKDFQVFSSSDLKKWKFERTILTLGEDVKWSDGNAWAPCIMERKQPDGTYKYYFYFCGALKGDGRKCIGCAVADDPLGPFTDIGRPVVDFKPEGVRGGQEIDPDVFRDPASGKYYLYWGNGYMAGAELADDMLSVKRDTVKVFRPGRTFREGTNVIYRNGKYYFSWSVDDTGSPNYHVRYAMADSPLGDLTVPRDNVVIEKNPTKGILGTGHHQILKVHGADDEWRIVYHRFAWQNGRVMDGPGFHREVCIDKLEFNEDGSIRKVIPTL